MMGGFTYSENADMHYMYGRANGNDRSAQRMYHAQFPDQRLPDHRIFQQFHRQLREIGSFHVTRHDAGRQSPVHSPSLEESILILVADRPESSTRAVVHPISQTVCRV
ncbi:uncharacterized protein TNCV_300741 [Trichonephila clavipes]|nr:uncharacterized protein TNCV_300741 [Trichonephila clavipes]